MCQDGQSVVTLQVGKVEVNGGQARVLHNPAGCTAPAGMLQKKLPGERVRPVHELVHRRKIALDFSILTAGQTIQAHPERTGIVWFGTPHRSAEICR